MTTAAGVYPKIGMQPVGNFWAPDVFSTSPTDLIMNFLKGKLGEVQIVEDPYWGGLEVIQLRVAASQTVLVGSVLTWDVSYNASLAANSANQARPVGMALNKVTTAANQSAVIYAVISGRFTVASNASVAAASPIGIAAAGLGGASAAGKEIENMVSVAAATITSVKTCLLTNGSKVAIYTGPRTDPTGWVGFGAGLDGWFPGLAMTGTGMPASTTIATIDPDNRRFTLNNAATSGGAQSLTATYNDATTFWNVASFDRPFAQGRIT